MGELVSTFLNGTDSEFDNEVLPDDFGACYVYGDIETALEGLFKCGSS